MATTDTDYKSSSTGKDAGEVILQQPTVTTITTKVGTPKNIDLFISYQWDSKDVVRHIYNGLTKKGFHCWMDVQNIESGRKLFEEIADGITNCRVLISCVTEKYLESESCRREVILADQLKKPIIPLLLEMIWPVKGPLGLIYSELVYIDVSICLEEVEAFQCAEVDALLKGLKFHFPDLSTSNSSQELVSSTTDLISSITDIEFHMSIRSDSDEVVSPRYVEDSSQTDSTGKADQATEISGTDIIKLNVFYNPAVFTPRRSHPAINQTGKGRWSGSQIMPYIRCQGVGVAGWTPFTEIRAALKPLFENGERITKIEQQRGTLRGKVFAEVTSVDDEFPDERQHREFCDADGQSTSFPLARPMSEKCRLGSEVFISGGQRRTTVFIHSS